MFVPNVSRVSLNPRPNYREMIVAGAPEAFGRIVAMSDDRRLAHVIWRGTPGTFRFQPDAATVDTCIVISGQAIVRPDHGPPASLSPGALFEFPRTAFELQIVEEFLKVSVLYNPQGLQCQVEPL